MKKALRDRYYYGVSEWPSFLSPEAEIVYKSPGRQEQLIKLAQAQIQVQRQVADEIELSSIQAAEVVATEIRQQATDLNGRLHESLNILGDRVVDAFQEGVGALTNKLGVAADQICAELIDIKWQLAQQQGTLLEIFRVLYESRSNEARQLVSQGVRLFSGGELPLAKNVFLKALDFDATDYQALMNLGYLALEDNDYDVADSFFKKALKLPETLTPPMQVMTLNALARLHYSNHDFDKAFLYGTESVRKNERQDPEDIYKLGIYAFLSGKKDLVIENIKKAIQLNSIYFSKAAVEPDLVGYKNEIMELLGRLSSQAKDSALANLAKTKEAIDGCTPGKHKETNGLLEQIKTRFERWKEIGHSGGYSNLRELPNELQKSQEVITEIGTLRTLLDSHDIKKAQKEERTALYEKKKSEYADDLAYSGYAEKVSWLDEAAVYVPVLGAIIAYIFIGIRFAAIGSAIDRNFEPAVGVVWPLALILIWLTGVLGDKNDKAIANASGSLVFIVLCILGAIWLVIKAIKWGMVIHGQNREERSAQCKKEVAAYAQESSSLSQEVSIIQTEVYQQARKIDQLIMTFQE